MTMHKVTLRPSNQIIEIDSNTSLLTALVANNIYIKSSCGGVASCSDCICKVVLGEDNLESPPFAELKLLGNVFHITKERLTCQTKVVGDVTIDISTHDKATDEEKLKSKTTKNTTKKSVTKVRSQSDFQKIKDERYKERLKNNEKDKNWEKFWEKNPDSSVKKGLGGGKRPKFFDTDKAIEETKQDLIKRDQKRDFYSGSDLQKKTTDKKMANTPDNKVEENEEVQSDKNFKKFRRE
jgi:ferredoxin